MSKLFIAIIGLLLCSQSILAVNQCIGRKKYVVNVNFQTMANRFDGNIREIITVDSLSKIFRFPALSYTNLELPGRRGQPNYFGEFEYRGGVRRMYGYKFAVGVDCQINVSPYVYDHRRDPIMGFHHHLLAGGKTCADRWFANPNTRLGEECSVAYTAGVIFFFHNGLEVEKVVVANRSIRFNNPVVESLNVVRNILREIGVRKDRVIFINRPNI